MAVFNKRWFTNSNDPFRTKIINKVENRSYTASIRPGYILMQNTDYLEQNYNDDTRHAKLLHDFTGKSKKRLEAEGTFYLGYGFSYQEYDKLDFLKFVCDSKCLFTKWCLSFKARDTKTGAPFCDFKDNSGTFNGNSLVIPGQGRIQAYKNHAGSSRTTEVADMIKLVINHWRATKNRVLEVSKIRSWMNHNSKIKNIIPKCP